MHFNIILCFWTHLDSCSLLWTHFRGADLIVFGFTQLGPEPKIYRTRGEHANHYATDAVKTF